MALAPAVEFGQCSLHIGRSGLRKGLQVRGQPGGLNRSRPRAFGGALCRYGSCSNAASRSGSTWPWLPRRHPCQTAGPCCWHQWSIRALPGPQSKPSTLPSPSTLRLDAANVQHQHRLVRPAEHALVEGGHQRRALAAWQPRRGCAGRATTVMPVSSASRGRVASCGV